MPDIFLEWDEDFQIDASGDLLTVTGDDEVRQLLERRLFTAVEGYVWHPEYGAGLPQKIGSVFSREQIQSIVNSQVALEATVAPNPPPVVTVQQNAANPANVTINIQYFDAGTGDAVSFNITL